MAVDSPLVPTSTLRDEHAQSTQAFLKRAAQLGYGDLSNYYWYHTIDLGDSWITPGVYDYRESLDAFQFPQDMQGMQVLDVGAATGFFSFEFEKRGARVISVELPSLLDVDKFPGETLEQTLRKLEAMMPAQSTYSPEQRRQFFQTGKIQEFYFNFLQAPFDFCRTVLKSQVQRCYSTIYDLSSEKLGGPSFDLVFIGDVLLHTVYPLKALAAAAAVCSGTLVISQALPKSVEDVPAMIYVGGDKPGSDEVSWWWPNQRCFEQILLKLGFSQAEVIGHHTGTIRPGGGTYQRAILRATR
jgi:SAM-dependent methyltransferase